MKWVKKIRHKIESWAFKKLYPFVKKYLDENYERHEEECAAQGKFGIYTNLDELDGMCKRMTELMNEIESVQNEIWNFEIRTWKYEKSGPVEGKG